MTIIQQRKKEVVIMVRTNKKIIIGVSSGILIVISVIIAMTLMLSNPMKVTAYGSEEELISAYPNPTENDLENNVFLVDGHLYLWSANDGWVDTGTTINQTPEEVATKVKTEYIDSARSYYQTAVMGGYKGSYAEFLQLVNDVASGRVNVETVYNQVTEAVSTSAYKEAVKNGFEGTEKEFVEKLSKALKSSGQIDEIISSIGYKGNMETFLARLRGPKGDKGANGLDAYVCAVANGYVGTLEEWSEDLANVGNISKLKLNVEEMQDAISDLNTQVVLATDKEKQRLVQEIDKATKELKVEVSNQLALCTTKDALDKKLKEINDLTVSTSKTIENTIRVQEAVAKEAIGKSNTELATLANKTVESLKLEQCNLDTNLNSRINEFKGKMVSDLAKAKTELEKAIAEGDAKVQESLTNKIAELTTGISSTAQVLQSNIDSASSLVGQTQESLLAAKNDLQNKLATQKTELEAAIASGNKTLKEKIESDIALTEAKIDTVNSDMAIVSQELADAKISITEAEEDLTAKLEADKLALQKAIADGNTALQETLNAEISTTETEIAELNTKLTNINNAITETQSDLETAKAALQTSLVEKQQELQTAIENNDTAAQARIQQSIDAMTSDIAAIDTNLKSMLSETKTELTGKISTATASLDAYVQQLKDAIAAIEAENTQLNKDTETWKTSMETQINAALAALEEYKTKNTVAISNDGYWVIGGVKTTYKAVGKDGIDG